MQHLKFKAWVHAARLRTLPLAIAGSILASLIAYYQNGFHWDVFALSLITILLLQILSNLANDYGDFSHGTDNEHRIGPERAVQSGKISPKEMKRAIYIVGLLAFHAGMFLLTAALDDIFDYVFILFLITGLVAIGAAIKYTVGKSNFGYKGYGDLMVFLFFGIAAVFGTYFLHTLSFDSKVLLPATAIGFLSAGVLNVNNLRDIENDKASGKNTMVVRMGIKLGKVYHLLLIMGTMGLSVIYLHLINKPNVMLSLIFPASLLIIHLIRVLKNSDSKKLDPELKRLALTTLLLSLWIGIGINI